MQRFEIDDLIVQVESSRSLTAKQRYDALKTLNCLVYIRNKLDWIAGVVNDIHNLRYYAQPDDHQKGVLRDLSGTSFHITGFKNGAAARQNFEVQLNYIEKLLAQLTPAQRLVFAARLIFHHDRGCLTERLAGGLNYAEEIIEDRVKINSVFAAAQVIARRERITLMQAAKQYCKDNEIMRVMQGNTKVNVDDSVFSDYIRTVLSENEAYIPAKEDPIAVYKSLCAEFKPTIVLGQQGMVQCRFSSKQSGDEFAEKVKTLDVLQGLEAEKIHCTYHGNPSFIVRLTQEQFMLINPQGLMDLDPKAKAAEAERIAKVNVLAIADAINQKKCWIYVGLFGKKTASPVPTKTAGQILQLVKKAHSSVKPDTWRKIHAQILKKLDESSFLRDPDTRQFYDDLKKQYPSSH